MPVLPPTRETGAGLRPVAAALALLAGLHAAPAAAQIVTFSAQDLMKGTKATEAQCAKLPKSVYVTSEGEGICIRYYISEVAEGRAAAVFFPGDSFGFDEKGKIAPDPGYLTQAPEYIDAAIRVWARRLQVPVIFFGRPGLHGSSGWHGDRRTRIEIGATLAALEKIKAREKLTGFHLVGQSGGGILAAAALAKRADIGCAAIASTPLAFAGFARHWKITLRTNGRRAHYDALADAAAIAARTERTRLILLTDPADTAVPPPVQAAFADAVRGAGGRLLHLFTDGRGKERHALTEKAMFSAAMCVAGKSDSDIEKRYGGTAADDLPPP